MKEAKRERRNDWKRRLREGWRKKEVKRSEEKK